MKATPKVEDLLSFLKAANIETLSSPVLTGEWEYTLQQIENDSFIREIFVQKISDLTEAIFCPFDRCFLYDFIGKHAQSSAKLKFQHVHLFCLEITRTKFALTSIVVGDKSPYVRHLRIAIEYA
ncbi:MAG: hypothetical protein LBT03_03835 [Holosporales bacterium]|nr:hypothetical protein [Holosporales bacterium]